MDEQAHSAASDSSCSSDDSIIFGEDDTDGEEGDLIVLAAVVAFNQAKKQRQSAYIRDRLEWEEHVQRLNLDSPNVSGKKMVVPERKPAPPLVIRTKIRKIQRIHVDGYGVCLLWG